MGECQRGVIRLTDSREETQTVRVFHDKLAQSEALGAKQTTQRQYVISEDSDNTLQGEEIALRRDRRESSEETYTVDSVSVKSEIWSPATYNKRTEALVRNITDFRQQTVQLGTAKEKETSMQDLLAMMIKMQTDNEKNALERKEQRLQREIAERNRREEEQARRDDQRDRETREMLAALKDNIPAVPQTIHIENTKLPRMVEGEDAEVFIELFEAALTDNNIQADKWRGKLHASLDTGTKLKVRDIIINPASSYQDIRNALVGCGTLTFSASSEAITSAIGERSLTYL